MKNVETLLLENPKKAIIKVSKPIIFAMFLESIYSFVDSIWVSGLGANALAAIGASFPIIISIYAVSWGLGVGASSGIARKIGAKDKEGAINVANHAIILALIFGGLYLISIYPNIFRILDLMGVYGICKILAIEYLRVLVLGVWLFTTYEVLCGVLRGEGNTKIVMIASAIGTLTNIVLDPLFIYILHLNIAGASYATLTSIFLSTLILIYYLFIKKESYVRIDFSKFKFNFEVVFDLLRVSLPTALMEITVAISFFIMNYIIMIVGNSENLAVYTASLRITEIGFVPMLGLASGAISVIGASYGARNYEKLKTAYFYALKIGFLIEVIIVASIIAFAPILAYLFTYSKTSISMYEDLVKALRIVPFYLLFTPLILTTSSLFQGIGKGERSLIIALIRCIICHPSYSYIFAVIYSLGIFGVYLGLVIGDFTAGIFSFLIGILTLKAISKYLSKLK
ncbi:MAG: MATE family efflux transporter [Methanococci archaeon]|nr:MATE family efflux transporter [Methanococci archaeon]